MGAGASASGYASVEAALAAGLSQAEIDAYLAEHPEAAAVARGGESPNKVPEPEGGSADGGEGSGPGIEESGGDKSENEDETKSSCEDPVDATSTNADENSKPLPLEVADPAVEQDTTATSTQTSLAVDTTSGKGDSDPEAAAASSPTAVEAATTNMEDNTNTATSLSVGTSAEVSVSAEASAGAKAGADESLETKVDSTAVKRSLSLQMLKKYSKEQIAELQEHFDHIDLDKSGHVHVEELTQEIREHSDEMTEQEIHELIKMHDTTGSGELCFHEFVDMMGPILFPEARSASQISEADICESEQADFFNMVDADGDGFVTIDELRTAWHNMGENMSEEDLQEMVRQGDHDKDGKINVKEFAKMFG